MAAPLILVAGSLLRGTATAAADELADAVKRLATEAIQTAISWEQLELRLQTTTGSAQSAEIVFENLRELARSTPLEVEGLTNAFVQLQEAGIAPTDELLESLGNIAAAFGRDITDVSAATVAAVAGQTDALTQFGIGIERVGDMVRLTYRNQTIEVANSTEAIVTALRSLAEENFAGSMVSQANTVTGALRGLEAASADLAKSFIEVFKLDDLAIGSLQLGAGFIDSLRQFIDPTVDEEIEDLNGRIGLLNESLAGLLGQIRDVTIGSERAIFLQSQIDLDRQDRAPLVARRNELLLERERQRSQLAEVFDADPPVVPPSPPGRHDAQPSGLRVDPSLCDCIASLIESNRSPFVADGIPPGSPLIDGQVPGGAQGVGAPVKPEAIEKLIAAEDAVRKYADSVAKAGETSEQAKEASVALGNAAATAMAQIRDGSFSAADALDSLLDRLFQILVIAPLEQAITAFFEGVFSPTGPSKKGPKNVPQLDFSGLSATGGIEAHTGGIVGVSDLPTRLVSASAAGLAADEFPTVLRRGEGVFTPEQMGAMAPGGSGDVTVNVIDRRGTDAAPVEVTEKQNNGRREIEVLILDTVSRDIGRRGSVGQAIETTFGARRQGVR